MWHEILNLFFVKQIGTAIEAVMTTADAIALGVLFGFFNQTLFRHWPRTITTHRHRMGRIDRPTSAQCLENRLDEAVARIAGQAFTVRAEVRQLAAAIPDRHRWAGRNLA